MAPTGGGGRPCGSRPGCPASRSPTIRSLAGSPRWRRCPATGDRSRRRRPSTATASPGRWLWTGRSWTFHAEDPAPPMNGGALAPDPLSGGMLYFTYTPDTVDDPPPPDPTGTLDSETWL